MALPIRIALVDDHRLFRMAIKMILTNDPMLSVVGEYPDHSILYEINEIKPDIVICDLSLENGSGLELIKKIRKLFPEIKLLVMSMHKDEFHILQALENGSDGYLYKDDEPKEVIAAIKSIYSGNKYYSSNIYTVINDRIKNNPNHTNQPFLTKKEKEVVHFITQGLTSKEIANQMNLSHRTVETHRYNISNKLGFKNTAELIKLMTNHNL